MARKTVRTFIVIDADGKPAERSIQSLQKEVDILDDDLEELDEGGLGGLSQGVAGLADQFSHLAGPAAIGAIGLGLFKAAEATAEAAAEAKTLSTALDTSVEEASALNAAFGDVGLEMNDTTDIALQIGAALEDDAELAAALGVEVGEILTPIEALEKGIDRWDFLTPTQRAKAFGEEGVRQISRLVAEGESLEDLLAGVDETRIFSEDDAAAALEFQRAMAEVQALIEGITFEVGGNLLSAFSDVNSIAEELGVNLDSAGLAAEGIGIGLSPGLKIFSLIVDEAEKLITHGTNIEKAFEIISDDVFPTLRTGIDTLASEFVKGLNEIEEGTDDVVSATDRWKTALSLGDAWAELQWATAVYFNKSGEAWEAGIEDADDFGEKVLEAEEAERELIDAIIAYSDEIGALPDEKVTEIRLLLERGEVEEAAAVIAELTKPRDLIINTRIRRPDGNVLDGNVGDTGARGSTTNVTVNMVGTASMREVQSAAAQWTAANG